jgi:hypothetical protein
MGMTGLWWKMGSRDSGQFEQQSNCKQVPSSLPTRDTECYKVFQTISARHKLHSEIENRNSARNFGCKSLYRLTLDNNSFHAGRPDMLQGWDKRLSANSD